VAPGDEIEVVDAGRDKLAGTRRTRGPMLVRGGRRFAKGYCRSKEPCLDFVAIAAVKLWPPFVREALGQQI
jgi:hypothetical protein